MRVSISGGSGYLGGVILRQIADQGFESGKVLQFQNQPVFLPKNFSLVAGDVRNPDSLQTLFANTDVAIHCASLISISDRTFPALTETNVIGTQNVVDACLKQGVKRLIYISSTHAYDNHNINILNEQSPLASTQKGVFNPPYNISKSLAQQIVWQAKERLEVIVLAPSGILGPYQYKLAFMGKAIMDIYLGKFPALVRGYYHWIDVRDIAKMVVACITKKQSGECFLISSERKSIAELATLVHKNGGSPPPRFFMPIPIIYPTVGVMHFLSSLLNKQPLFTRTSLHTLNSSLTQIDCIKAKTQLGFSPRPISESICDMLHWYREHYL